MQIIDLAIEIIKADQRPYDGLKDIETADVEIRFCRTKTYDLVSKTNSLVALLNAGVDGLTSFNTPIRMMRGTVGRTTRKRIRQRNQSSRAKRQW